MWYSYAKRIISLKSSRFSGLVTSGVKEDLQAILQGDQERISLVRSLTPINKLQPALAYFLAHGAGETDLQTIADQLQDLDESRKVAGIQASKRGVNFNGQAYTDWISFSEAVHGLHAQAFPPDKPRHDNFESDLEDTNILHSQGGITVTKANNVNDTCRLGGGMSWCISQPGNGMYASYRASKASTFYFVHDTNQPVDSPLRRVVVDMTRYGPELTDVNNSTGMIAQFGEEADSYLRYLQSRGVDTSVFINNPLTREEKKLNEELSDVYESDADERLAAFFAMSPEMKSEYIVRGYKLSAKEFEVLVNQTGSKSASESGSEDSSKDAPDPFRQYIQSGHPLTEKEISIIGQKIPGEREKYISIYIRARSLVLANDPMKTTKSDAVLMPKLYRKNKPVLDEALEKYYADDICFNEVPAILKEDKDFALQAWNEYRVSFYRLPDSLREDTQFALKAWDEKRADFGELPNSLSKDHDFALNAWNESRASFYQLPESLRKNQEFALKAWENGKVSFHRLPESLRENKEFATDAWRKHKVNFLSLPDSLRKDPQFALKAWEDKRASFHEIPESLREDKDFVWQALKHGRLSFHSIPESLKEDIEFTLKAFHSGFAVFNDLPHSLQNDRNFVLQEFNNNTISYYQLPQSLKEDTDIALQAWNTNRAYFDDLPCSLQDDEKFALRAWNDQRVAYHQLPQSLREDTDFALKAWDENRVQFYNLPKSVEEYIYALKNNPAQSQTPDISPGDGQYSSTINQIIPDQSIPDQSIPG